MVIAIDFDNTWTEDTQLWNWFYTVAEKQGHTCIIATARKEYTEDMDRYDLPPNIPIVFCDTHYKEHACKAEGWDVNVWIDDMPMLIQPGIILGQDKEL